jgi:hypothetical protein
MSREDERSILVMLDWSWRETRREEKRDSHVYREYNSFVRIKCRYDRDEGDE